MANQRKVDLKIELAGEKEYKNAIADLNKGNQVLASELRKVQEQFKGNENSIEALNAKGDVLQRQLLQQQDKVQTLRAALQHAATEYGEADKRTQEWQIKLNNAETAQVKLERAIEENNKAINDSNAAMLKQQHSVEDLDKANEVLEAELRKVQEQYRGSEKSVEGLTTKGDLLQKQLEIQQQKVQRLRDALKESASQYGEADERTREWTIKLANAETEQLKLEHAIQENNDALNEQEGAMDRNEDAVGGLGEQLDGLAGKLGINIPDAAKSALNSFDGFSASTVAGLSTAAAGVAAFIKVTKELYELTKQAAAEADALLTRSAQTGLSTDLLQQLDYAQNFLDFDGLDKSLQRLTQSIGSATNASSKQAKAFKELGVEIYDENGKLRDNYEVFLDVIDALGRVENETQRDILANLLFSKSYAELKPLIAAGSEELKKYTDRAEEMAYVISEKDVRALGRLDDAIQENQTALKTAKTELGAYLSSIFETAVEAGTSAINMARSAFSNETVQSLFFPVIKTVKDLTERYQEAKEAKDAFDESAADTPDLSAAITPMQEAVQALADKYQEAQAKYKDLLDGQFGLFEDASERLLTDSDRAAQKLGELWTSAYESAEKSIQGQFGLLDFARTSYQQFADEYAKSWDATFQTVKSSVEGVWGTYEEAVGFSMKTAQEMNTAYDSQKHYWEWYDITLKEVLSSGIEGVREWAAATADGSEESAAALGGFLSATEEERQIIVDSFFQMKAAEIEAADAITDLKTRGSADMEAYAAEMREKSEELVESYKSQYEYLDEYEKNLEAVLSSGVDGIQEYVSQFAAGSAEAVEAVAILAASTDERKAEIVAAWLAVQEKTKDVSQDYGDMAIAGAESAEALAGSTESFMQRSNAALDSQLQYWQEYREDFDALKNRNIEGIDELAKKYMDGSAESKQALAELRYASDEEIAALIQKMREVAAERGDLGNTFAALEVDLAAQLALIKGDFASAVQEISGTAGAVDFTPFKTAVTLSFSYLTETAKTGNASMVTAFKDGNTGSQEELEKLKTGSAKKIEAIIETLGTTEQAKEDFTQRFQTMTEETTEDLDQIETTAGEFVEEFNGIIATVDFSPFTDSVDSAFSFLEDRAWNSIDNVRGWLAELSAEIDAIEARAANVNVGHNAGGTDNWRGGLTYLAENGPELVDLPQGSRVHTAQETRQILGGGTDMRETEAKLTQAVNLLGQISAELSGLRMRGRMV